MLRAVNNFFEMVPSSYAAATEDNSLTNIVTNDNSRSLQDGGSSVALTQGEIIFVTLACFVVVAAGIFAIYSVYKKRKARQNNNITSTTAAISPPVIAKGNGMDQFPKADVADSINNRGYSTDEERVVRRASIESVDSKGVKRSRRRSTGSAGSNVSNQYKVAAMNHMRRMSDYAEP